MSQTSIDDFAAQLRRFRRRSGLTQEELAERAGISPSSVSLLERGITHLPQRATLSLLIASLALTDDESAALQDAARRARQDSTDISAGPDVSSAQDHLNDGGLSIPLTAIFGREREEAAIVGLLLGARGRLLTLTGPAGVGKTCLALHVAAALRREHGSEIAFVSLVPVQQDDRVLSTIALTLGVPDSGALPIRDAIVRTLRQRDRVLVLDNFEQVLPAARVVLDLLIACPRLKALITSRSPLNVRGEQLYPVQPLAVPAAEHALPLEEVVRVPAVALFLDRAQAAQPDFALTSTEDGRLVTEICARLDGLPLAIELAAARVRQVSLRHLHSALNGLPLFGMLADGPQDLPEHQRTMRSAIAWSYHLLTTEEQRLFRALSVFAGGATMESAQAVAGDSETSLRPLLSALVNASLLQSMSNTGRERYTQLVTLRAFGQEVLRASGEWDQVHRRLTTYILSLINAFYDSTTSRPSGVLLDLETEYENVRVALGWALEADEIELGLHVVGAFWRFWFNHGPMLEGLDWLERYIERTSEPKTLDERAALASAWTGVLAISHRLDQFDRACAAGEHALALRRSIGDKALIARALNGLANPLVALRAFDRALALYEEGLACARDADVQQVIVVLVLNLGVLRYEMGRPHEALAAYDESLAVSRAIGESDLARALTKHNIAEVLLLLDQIDEATALVQESYRLFAEADVVYGMAICAFTRGRAAWRAGAFEAASAHLDESARLFHTLGNARMVARILCFRANIALELGNLDAARQDLARALAESAGVVQPSGQAAEGDWRWLAVERVGALACRSGSAERAALLYGAAIAHRESVPGPLEPAERDLRSHDLEQLRLALGDAALAGALASGAVLSLHDALQATHEALGH